ncbi:hypothetical protein VTL71DRAFT_11146 [Oculimacula yallundae]|uniref:Uncharacterized protein n=1 Tax=Oculimacula yallundae TaxID=86028 RepID=A0ABR4CV31_9HELO
MPVFPAPPPSTRLLLDPSFQNTTSKPIFTKPNTTNTANTYIASTAATPSPTGYIPQHGAPIPTKNDMTGVYITLILPGVILIVVFSMLIRHFKRKAAEKKAAAAAASSGGDTHIIVNVNPGADGNGSSGSTSGSGPILPVGRGLPLSRRDTRLLGMGSQFQAQGDAFVNVDGDEQLPVCSSPVYKPQISHANVWTEIELGEGLPEYRPFA